MIVGGPGPQPRLRRRRRLPLAFLVTALCLRNGSCLLLQPTVQCCSIASAVSGGAFGKGKKAMKHYTVVVRSYPIYPMANCGGPRRPPSLQNDQLVGVSLQITNAITLVRNQMPVFTFFHVFFTALVAMDQQNFQWSSCPPVRHISLAINHRVIPRVSAVVLIMNIGASIRERYKGTRADTRVLWQEDSHFTLLCTSTSSTWILPAVLRISALS